MLGKNHRVASALPVTLYHNGDAVLVTTADGVFCPEQWSADIVKAYRQKLVDHMADALGYNIDNEIIRQLA